MNAQQKKLVRSIINVVLVTVIFVLAVIVFKDHINRSESMLAMRQLGKAVLDYRQKTGVLPAEYDVRKVIRELEGSVRVGEIRYRAQWITYESDPNTVLAYVKKNYNVLFGPGYVSLYLNGNVEWVKKEEFEKLLQSQ